HGHLRRPPSFPTRRSSDLPLLEGIAVAEPAVAGRRVVLPDLLGLAQDGAVELGKALAEFLVQGAHLLFVGLRLAGRGGHARLVRDRKSTRLNSSHVKISYA